MLEWESVVKISPPKVGNIYFRAGLIKQVQDASQRCVVWISAQAGAGKTTLVVDYLTKQSYPAIWYQMDAGDTDPSAFFHYLAMASQHLRQKNSRLPTLMPEYVGSLPVFTRRFTEQLCAGMSSSVIFVFDNFQDLPQDSPLQTLFKDFIVALPEGFRAFFLGREKPPPWFASFLARNDALLLDRDDLRLSEEESVGIVRLLDGNSENGHSDEDIRQIHHKVDGWAVGLILTWRLLQKTGDREISLALEDEHSHELIFDYFASELFGRISPEKQMFLLQSALLPVMSVDLVHQLTGHPDTARILDELYARNFFLSRTNGTESFYKYHPLFHKFLLNWGQKHLGQEQLNNLRRQASQVLLDAGQAESALDLALINHDWPTAANIMVTQAPQLLGQGRNQTLLSWLQRLPKTLLAETPWLLYWQGVALDGHAPLEAGKCFTAAYPLFEQAGDVMGRYLTIANALLVSWMTQQNHHGIDLWLQRFDQLYARHPAIAPAEIEARVVAAVLMGMYFRRPDHPQAETLLARARHLWALPLEANLRWQLGSAIGFYLSGRGDLISWGKTMRVYETAAPTGAGSPLEHLHLLLSLAFVDCFGGAYAASREYVRRGLSLSEHSGVHVYDLFLLAVGTYNGLMQIKVAEADSYLEQMRLILSSQPPNFHTVHYRLLLNWRALVTGQLADAVDHGKAALELAVENGAVYPLARCRHGLALALFSSNRPQEALGLLEQVRIPWGISRFQQLVYDSDLSEAWFRLQMGEEEAAANLLADALQQGITQGWGLPLWSFPDWIEPLLMFALERGIETAHVQQLIRQTEIIPRKPAGIPTDWPMPVRIKTLGGFAVEAAGKQLSEETHSKNRPMELLKVLIAFGGRDVADERLMDILWPDASGDAASRTLHTTLHRLRKILGDEQAVTLKDRTVSLDPRHVWLDVWTFEYTLEQLRQQLDGPRPNPHGIRRLWDTVHTLYAGPFLGKGAQKSWALDMAERLRSRLLRFTSRVGEYWEQAGEWEQAIHTYNQGLQIDPLIETFHQRLMYDYEQAGKLSAALVAYEHCREVLGKGLGVMPGTDTVKLYKAIRNRSGLPLPVSP